MVTSFEFETVEEFEEFAENARDKICSCILFSLGKAFEEGENDPIIFDVTVRHDTNIYEIFLNKSEWITGLTTCIEVFTDRNLPDEAIDTYLLIQKLKQEVDISELSS